MRTGTIEIDKKRYLLCFSARVIRDCTERYGKLERIDEAMNDDDEAKMMDECFWLLSQMMQAGSRYASLQGIDNPKPLQVDDLYDLCGVDDLLHLKVRIFETIESGTRREIEVETEPEKNGEATQPDLPLSGTSGMPCASD